MIEEIIKFCDYCQLVTIENDVYCENCGIKLRII